MIFGKLHKTFAFAGAILCALTLGAFAEEPPQDLSKGVSDAQIFRPEKRETKVELVDSSKANSIHLNVDIFGSLDVQSYYILWDRMEISDDLKKMMTTRDFARAEFFMPTASSSSRNACCSSSKTASATSSRYSPKRPSRNCRSRRKTRNNSVST